VTLPFLDTNVVLRHVLGDHPDQSPRARAFLSRIESGDVRVRTTDTVVFEAVFTLERSYKIPRTEVRDVLVPLLELPGVVLPNRNRLLQAFAMYVELNIPFNDAYHVATMRDIGSVEIVSFDAHFDRVDGIVRTEP
jgi:predicted nucleic acid-binding protein